MKKYTKYILIFLIAGGAFSLFFICEYFCTNFFAKDEPLESHSEQKELSDIFENEQADVEKKHSTVPLVYFEKRITKKPFGIYITPETSPTESERFRGYHTGVDFEVFDDEYDEDVVVRAICDGAVRMRQDVSGYGGVLMQECKIHDENVTVLYGHLDLNSVTQSLGEKLSYGSVLGVLGRNQSVQTDGERKHLHLSIHRGKTIDVRGYVSSQAELRSWIDPCNVLICSQ